MKLTTPLQAFHYLFPRISTEAEEFWAVALNSEKEVLSAACLFRGTVDLCLFHPRDVFRFSYRHNASALIVAHNHPTGAARPSAEDRTVTRQLINASAILQVPVVDHLILEGNDFYSFLQAGELTIDPSLSAQSPD
jgi:DNA repair protein RadC